MKLATLCYVKDGNKTLMLYRNKKENDYHEGKWNGLGGKLEIRESPEDCARREVFEESGLIVKDLQLKGFITFPLFDGKDDWYVWLYFITDWEGELKDSPEGELAWIDDDKLSELNLWDGDKIFIDWMFKGKTFSAKFNYNNGNYVNHEVSFY
ncbi:MAG: 7,8-dihydro-8-oxoguanine triphosphatase [Melioribacteraceae bacterium]|nr:MAG: 7,8-dihydro-8-oxoguanine triphosphatase [Melioribacteraceae bacterium]